MKLQNKRNIALFLKESNYYFRYYTGVNAWHEPLTKDVKIRIENYWRDVVQHRRKKPQMQKYYVLSMFPYPSGRLHMGHVRQYTISDAMARFHRMNGREVIHPMGWDSFGLPAENAALQQKLPPEEWTRKNIATMKDQLQGLACSFDWDREVTTSQPAYYKWTQFIFLKLYEHGLVYRKEAFVNWDPVDKTVLADEQVDSMGNSWRSGAKVEKKVLPQWYIRTTAFAKQLLDGLTDPTLEAWRDIINLQRHWIGECNGIVVDFKVVLDNSWSVLRVWTDRAEAFTCASFVAVLPGSVLDQKALVAYEGESFKKLRINAHNPITDMSIPIYVTSQLPYPEGAECYLGAPALSECDKEFALRIGLRSVPDSDMSKLCDDVERSKEHICKLARLKGVGGYKVSSKLKDWLISRQRYWGTPIPVVHCKNCGAVPLPYSQLPVLLPSERENSSWMSTLCPQCQGVALRETDTMDTFVDSSWYYLRYLDPSNEHLPFDPLTVADSLPVDLYIGGKEHAVLHLYYARFMSHFLQSIGMVQSTEPFKRLLVQGMVMGKSYKLKKSGKYLSQSEVNETIQENGKTLTTCKSTGDSVDVNWEKMSKSKFNGIDPEEVIKEYGIDTTRLFILADFAPTSHRKWSSATFPGVLNWQDRLWMTTWQFIKGREAFDQQEYLHFRENSKFTAHEMFLRDKRNYAVANATFSYFYAQQISAAICRMQALTIVLRKCSKEQQKYSQEYELALAAQILMLAPMAPHFACELWSGFQSAKHRLNPKSPVIDWDHHLLHQAWPALDPYYPLEIICKVNGNERCRINISQTELKSLTVDKAVELAMRDEGVGFSTRNGIQNSVLFVAPGCRAELNIFPVIKRKENEENSENKHKLTETL